MSYLNWASKTITDLSTENIEKLYDAGFVFTRLGKGVMNQTRSFRIDLAEFDLTSENRRILKKASNYTLEVNEIPFSKYDWHIGKMAKDFYAERKAEFSANKVKELIAEPKGLNFNRLYVYKKDAEIGYAICLETDNITHYSYPFYAKDASEPSRGLAMMMLAINRAKELGKKYIYLGSLQRPSDTYKLQFKSGEWFDGKNWQKDPAGVKDILK